jgi:hypothetical protein
MFRKIKTRTALGAITAITAIAGASALGSGSAAHTPQAATVKTASITDVLSQLKWQASTPSFPKTTSSVVENLRA